MAMKLSAGETSRIDVFGISPEFILRDDGENSRATPHSEEEIEALAQTIFDQGQLQPVLARRIEQNKVKLVAGYGRVKAIAFINAHPERFPLPEPLKVLCRVIECSAEEAYLKSIAENLERAETTPLDDAHNQRRLREVYLWPDEKIATFYKKSVSHINKLRKLPTLETDLQQKVARGDLAVSTAVDLADVPAPVRKTIVENSTEQNGKVSSSKAKKGIREHQEKTGEGQVKQRTIKEVKEFFDKMTGGDEDEGVSQLYKKLLLWIGGSVSDAEMASWSVAHLTPLGLDATTKKGKK